MANKKLKHDPKDEKKTSFVPPIIAGIASIIPGLGQILARAIRRGIIVFISFLTVLGLSWWRFTTTAKYDEGFLNIFKKGLTLDKSLIWVTVFVVLLYLIQIYDAYRVAKNSYTEKPNGILVMAVILFAFFLLGWQIGQINMVDLISGMDEASAPISRIAWPWEAALTYPEEYVNVIAEIQVPCIAGVESPIQNEPSDSDPYLISSPTCGSLSDMSGGVGSTLHLEGGNFEPGIEVEIMWEDPNGQIFRQRQDGEYVVMIPDENGDFSVDIIMPYRLLPPSADAEFYIWEVFAKQLMSIGEPHLSDNFINISQKMIETIFIGMMATFFGVIFALPVSFLAARNLMNKSKFALSIYYIVRAIFNIIRSIEPLIWGLIFVIMVGLGPFAGILALTLHSIAALGKLYSESIESIDDGPIEAIKATGANWLQIIRYAVIPQIIPPFVSFTIYRWDINIRMSTVIGLVGGGGVGFLLSQYIRLFDYRAAGICVWFIALTVIILDYVSAEIRERFV